MDMFSTLSSLTNLSIFVKEKVQYVEVVYGSNTNCAFVFVSHKCHFILLNTFFHILFCLHSINSVGLCM